MKGKIDNYSNKNIKLLHPMLAIDYGTKKMGVSITDRAGKVPMMLTTIVHNDNIDKANKELLNVIRSYKIATVIVGYPIMPYQTATLKKIKTFVEEFTVLLATENLSIVKIITFDESFTTQDAKNLLISMGYKGKSIENRIDMAASLLILMRFLKYEQKD